MSKPQDSFAREARKQRLQDKSVIDELSRPWSRGRVIGSQGRRAGMVHGGELANGDSVQEHIRREWSPSKGGLPTF